MGPLEIAQACVKKVNTPLVNGRIDYKFWFLVMAGVVMAASSIRAIPGMQTMLQEHDTKIAVIENNLKLLPKLVAAEVVIELQGRRK